MLDSLDTLIAFALIFTVVSLLITIAVQMITSAANLRGKNAAWGLAETFETIAPDLAAQVEGKGKALADHLLKDPLISDNQIGKSVKMAAAVRADEMFDLLHRIATGKKPSTPDEIKGHVITLLINLGVDKSIFEKAEDKLSELNRRKQGLDAALAKLPDGPDKNAVQAVIAGVTQELSDLAAGAKETALRWLAQGEEKIQAIYQKFEHWFETGQERAQEWFKMHAWWVTLGLSVAAALVLQIDTFEIFRKVSANREMRDKLVAQSATVLKQAEHTFSDTGNVLNIALEKWRAALPAEKMPADLKKLKADPGDTRGTLVSKVEAALKDMDVRTAWLANLGAAIDTAAQEDVKTKAGDYRAATATLDDTGFELFPRHGWRWQNSYWHHFPGILCSILLLSLGAPFWFNMLKSLASLRSSVAGNISSEKTADRQKGNADKPGGAPVTIKETSRR